MSYHVERTTNGRGKAPGRVNTVGAKPGPARDTTTNDCRVDPIRGSRSRYSAGMFDYIVMLKQQPGSNPSRREVYEAGIARSTAFRHKLEELLKQQGLCEELGALSEPLGLPIVTLTCTPKLASIIRSLPEVETVTRDSADIQFVR